MKKIREDALSGVSGGVTGTANANIFQAAAAEGIELEVDGVPVDFENSVPGVTTRK